jgi:formiminotetrahydrofolate cyclodeaminase
VTAPGPTGFRALPLRDFVNLLASAEPVPGGGSASAVAASLAAALVAMVASLSQGRARYADHAELHAWGASEGRRLAHELLVLAEEDAGAYATLAAAFKLPRDTEAQRADRASATRSGARLAAEVPLRCVEACRDVVRVAEALAGRTNINASSDLNVAALLAEAAARGAAANVLVNLPSVDDAAYATETTARVSQLIADVERLARETRRIVETGEARPPHVPGTALA